MAGYGNKTVIIKLNENNLIRDISYYRKRNNFRIKLRLLYFILWFLVKQENINNVNNNAREVLDQNLEGNAEGGIGKKIYKEYLKLGTGCFGILIWVIMDLTMQSLYVFADWWLTKWLVATSLRLWQLRFGYRLSKCQKTILHVNASTRNSQLDLCPRIPQVRRHPGIL